jgi:hypothetical protein
MACGEKHGSYRSNGVESKLKQFFLLRGLSALLGVVK